MDMDNLVFNCDLDADTKTTLQIYLYSNVQNVDVIRDNVMKGMWNCAVIKASLVAAPLQVAVAANKAAVAHHHNTMVTKTVYAEILYNLSLTKNISQSLQKFGIDKTNSLLFCFLIRGEKDDTSIILSQIEGEQRPIADLPNYTNMKEIKSLYKLNNLRGNEDFLDLIVSKMVTKNFISH